MGFNLFFIGMFFLANPNINIIDIIPDFIGCALMWYSLSKLRDLAPDMANTRNYAAKLFWLEIGKLISLLIFINLSLDSGFLLTFSFVFVIAEALLYIPMMNSFFNGILFLGTKYDADNSLKLLEKTKRSTVVFIISRSILTFFPELTYLYVIEDVGYILEPYKGVVIVASVILQIISGLLWLLTIVKYKRCVLNDSVLINSISEYYEKNITSDTGLFTRRKIKTGALMLCTFSLLSVNIFFDGKRVLPSIACIIAAVITVIAWRSYSSKRIKNITVALCTLSGIICIFTDIIGNRLAGKYYFLGISHSIDAYRTFLQFMVIDVIRNILFISINLCIVCILYGLIDKQTGVDLHNELPSVIERERNRKKAQKRRCIIWAVFSVITACSSIAASACLYLWQPYMMIDIAIHIVWFCITLRFYFSFNEQLENRYM